jgi:hypothetical protein
MRMKKNDQLKSLLLEQLRKTPVIQIACDKTQVSRASFYRWRADDEVFAKAVDEALLDCHLLVNDLAETQLINAVKERNFAAIAYWLKHHHPSYKTKVEIEGTISTIQELSPEQKELVRKALSLANLTLESHDV